MPKGDGKEKNNICQKVMERKRLCVQNISFLRTEDAI